MSEEFELTDELRELESQLRELSPVASKLDQDALLYRAGWEAAHAQAAVTKPRRQPTVSQLLAATFAATSAALALMLLQPSTSTPDVANTASSVAVENPMTPSSHDVGVSTPPSTLVEASILASMKRRSRSTSRHPVGRRDPERWLRTTDRMTIADSTSLNNGSPTTIRDLYKAFPLSPGDRI